MGRRNIYRRSRPAGLMEEIRRVLAAGGSWRDVEKVLWQVRDPKAREELLRLADSCWLCGEHGHKRAECPAFICDHCGQGGHKAKRCPERQGGGAVPQAGAATTHPATENEASDG